LSKGGWMTFLDHKADPSAVSLVPRRAYPKVTIFDETMREGFQIESVEIPIDSKVRVLDALSQTGLRNIVVGSFVSPIWTPQMKGIEEIIDRFTPESGVSYSALALNRTGVERRKQFIPPLELRDVIPCTTVHLCDVFVRRNTNRSQGQEIEGWPGTVDAAVQAGAAESGIGVNAAFGSNWLGDFPANECMALLKRQHELWYDAGVRVTKVFLGDPMGWNSPDQVEYLVGRIRTLFPEITIFHLHLHNSRGTAPISVFTALRALDEACELILDTALGGMGGCPYCGNGRAAGMMPTEDLVDLLEELGIPTGINIDKLIDAVWLAEEILGRPLAGHVSKAGPRPRGKDRYPMDLPFIETFEQARHFRLGAIAYPGAMSPWRSPIVSPYRND